MISFLRKMLSFVVLRCPVLSSKILPLQRIYPISFGFQASPDRAGMGTRPYDNRNRNFLDSPPKIFVFFVCFRFFSLFENLFSPKFSHKISPLKGKISPDVNISCFVLKCKRPPIIFSHILLGVFHNLPYLCQQISIHHQKTD